MIICDLFGGWEGRKRQRTLMSASRRARMAATRLPTLSPWKWVCGDGSEILRSCIQICDRTDTNNMDSAHQIAAKSQCHAFRAHRFPIYDNTAPPNRINTPICIFDCRRAGDRPLFHPSLSPLRPPQSPSFSLRFSSQASLHITQGTQSPAFVSVKLSKQSVQRRCGSRQCYRLV